MARKDLNKELSNNIGVSTNQSQGYSFTALKRFRPGKDQNRANRWNEQFAPIVTGWPSSRCLDLFKSLLDGPAYDWFIGAQDEDFNDVVSFEKEFLSMFGMKPANDTLELYKGILDGIKREETLGDFAIRIRALAKPTNQPFLEIRNAIAEKLPIWAQTEALLQEDWKNIIETLSKLDERRSHRETKTNSESNNQIPRSQNGFNKDKSVGRYNKSEKNSLVTCFKCKKEGHYANKCPKSQDQVSAVILEETNNLPILTIFVNKRKIEALVDTGANISSISFAKAKELNLKIYPTETLTKIKHVNGESCGRGYANTKIRIFNKKIPIKLTVLDSQPYDIILGTPVLSELGCIIDLDKNFINIAGERIAFGGKNQIKIASVSKTINFGTGENVSLLIGDDKILENDAKEAKVLCEEYRELFVSEKYMSKIPIKHRIGLKDSAIPTYKTPYRKSKEQNIIVKDTVEKMLKNGLIRPSTSEWGSPVLLVPKKTGKVRFCVDYRNLNKLTIKTPYPIPSIDEALDTLSGMNVFSVLDMESGFHQLQMEESSKKFTAFTTRQGLFEWNVMPFGLTNAPFTFQKAMSEILKEFIWKDLIVYLDDVILFSKNGTDHLSLLRKVFKKISSYSLKLNSAKCQIMRSSVQYLGHIVTGEGVRMSSDYQEKALNFKTPQNITELRSFLGFITFSRRFIKNFSKLAGPLYDMLKKNKKFCWNETSEQTFRKILAEVKKNTSLNLPDMEKEFLLETDASYDGIGAVLIQKNNESEVPIIYISRRLNSAEKNYSVTEKECLAIVWAVMYFRVYLTRRFIIRTDHQALKWLMSIKTPTGRLARWIFKLQPYDFSIEYLKGRENIKADVLSRLGNNEPKVIACSTSQREANIEELIKIAHEDSGHGGVNSTLMLLKPRYSWKNMEKDVKTNIKNCDTCLKYNKGPINLQKFRIPLNDPFYCIAIDCVGPLMKSFKGNKFIIIATDPCSRWSEARAVKHKSAQEIADFIFEEIICRHGAPAKMLSDQGREFLNAIVDKLLRKWNIKRSTTSAYNPKCNGLAERTNQTLTIKLAKLCGGRFSEWDEFLPYALLSYRISNMRKLGCSPFEFLYSRKPLLYSDNVDKMMIQEYEDSILENKDRRKSAFDLSVEKAKELRKREESRVKDGFPVDDIPIGGFCLRRICSLNKKEKLGPRFEGPHVVESVKSKGAYVIRGLDNKEILVNRKDLVNTDSYEDLDPEIED